MWTCVSGEKWRESWKLGNQKEKEMTRLETNQLDSLQKGQFLTSTDDQFLNVPRRTTLFWIPRSSTSGGDKTRNQKKETSGPFFISLSQSSSWVRINCRVQAARREIPRLPQSRISVETTVDPSVKTLEIANGGGDRDRNLVQPNLPDGDAKKWVVGKAR